MADALLLPWKNNSAAHSDIDQLKVAMNTIRLDDLSGSVSELLSGGGKSVFAGNVGYTQHLFRQVDG